MDGLDISNSASLTGVVSNAVAGMVVVFVFVAARLLKFHYYDWQIARNSDEAGMIDADMLRDFLWRRGEKPEFSAPWEIAKSAAMFAGTVAFAAFGWPWLTANGDAISVTLSVLPDYALAGGIGAAVVTLAVHNYRSWRQRYRNWRSQRIVSARSIIQGEIGPADLALADDQPAHDSITSLAIALGSGVLIAAALYIAGSGDDFWLQMFGLAGALITWGVSLWRKIYPPPPELEAERTFPEFEMPREAAVGLIFAVCLAGLVFLYLAVF